MELKVVTFAIVLAVASASIWTVSATNYVGSCECEGPSSTTPTLPTTTTIGTTTSDSPSAEDTLSKVAYHLYGMWGEFSKKYSAGNYIYEYEIRNPITGEARSQYQIRQSENITIGTSYNVDLSGTRRIINYKVGGRHEFLACAAKFLGNAIPPNYISRGPPLPEESLPNIPDYAAQTSRNPINTDILGNLAPLAKVAYDSHMLFMAYQKVQPHLHYYFSYEIEGPQLGAFLMSQYESRYGNTTVGTYSKMQPDGKRSNIEYTLDGNTFYVEGHQLN